MVDNSFLYNKDFEENYKKFKESDLKGLYSDLYKSGRLSSDSAELDKSELLEFVKRYNENVKIIELLSNENIRLQHWVHRLGIKNRVKKLLGRYRSLEDVRSYLSDNDMQDIEEGTFSANRVLPSVAFSLESLKHFNSLNHESFSDGVGRIQRSIKLPTVKAPPLVTIIIPTRNGISHLKRLFENFHNNTQYTNFEIIVVDNASTDGTYEYLKKLDKSFNISIIRNEENQSFSASNNNAAKLAKGSLLLFLNNDVVPTHGWLTHLVASAVKGKNRGAIGSKLIYPHKDGFKNSHKIQHGGLGFKLEPDFIRPVNVNNGDGFFESNTDHEEKKIGVTAACLLIRKGIFIEIGGFNEDYWYGYEDVDLCLKLNKAGYQNIINNASVLYHYEFGTQERNKETQITGYRKKNIEIFKKNWQKDLFHNYWKSLLAGDGIYTNKSLHVCFITTESKDSTAAGDYFTAKELGLALQNKGATISFIGVKNTPDPYAIPSDADVVISMIDGYDISKIKETGATKIAWCRNWFERWANQPYFRDFDIVLTNSEKSQEYFKSDFHIDSYLFKIATNKDRFSENFSPEILDEYSSDICFTGNYWHNPRDITELFEPKNHKNREIKLYGKDWNHIENFKPYHQGFINYSNIPKVYKAGKVLIDDATWIVNEWGSVNSRVFDGAASGILVLTNGVVGSQNTFNGLIPTFTTKEELDDLLNKYLGSESARKKKIKEIRDYVLKHHTYGNRAEELLDILKKENTSKRINIKMPIPSWSEAKNWGDLHFAQGMKVALEEKGFSVRLQILPEWYKSNFAHTNIVLRGLSKFTLPFNQLNIMWNISHPEDIKLNEYRAYDYVFVASNKHTKQLRAKGLKNVCTLLQSYDESRFKRVTTDRVEHKTDILYVGNTRNQFRKSVKWALTWDKIDDYNFKVYGKSWNKFIPSKYIGGESIPNTELNKYYSATGILLNDHWDDMNTYGFTSNRLFDASACGAFIISDKNFGIDYIFGKDQIPQYNTEKELHELLDKYTNDSKSRESIADRANKVILSNHSFESRIASMLETVEELIP